MNSVKHFDCSGVRVEVDGVRVDEEAPGKGDAVGSAGILESFFGPTNLRTRMMTTTKMVVPISAAAI